MIHITFMFTGFVSSPILKKNIILIISSNILNELFKLIQFLYYVILIFYTPVAILNPGNSRRTFLNISIISCSLSRIITIPLVVISVCTIWSYITIMIWTVYRITIFIPTYNKIWIIMDVTTVTVLVLIIDMQMILKRNRNINSDFSWLINTFFRNLFRKSSYHFIALSSEYNLPSTTVKFFLTSSSSALISAMSSSNVLWHSSKSESTSC